MTQDNKAIFWKWSLWLVNFEILVASVWALGPVAGLAIYAAISAALLYPAQSQTVRGGDTGGEGVYW